MSDQGTKPADAPITDEPTSGPCGWAVFSPQKQTWLGFALAWICVVAIIWLTAVFAKIGG